MLSLVYKLNDVGVGKDSYGHSPGSPEIDTVLSGLLKQQLQTPE